MEKKNIAILGAGAIGGFLASMLSKAGHEVTCIQKEEFIPKNGIQLSSAVFGNIKTNPRFVTCLDFAPDILFITVKAPHLPQAVEAVPKNLVKNSVIIPLLNGVDHIEFLRRYFGPRIAAGMIGAIEARSEEPGLVTHSSPQIPAVELASKNFPRERVTAVADLLRGAGLRSEVLASEEEVIWRKLVRLSAIAATTAAAQRPVGFVRSHPEWRRLLEGCARECAAVAQKEGANIDSEEVMRQIDALPENLTTSLQNDYKNKLTGERDAIVGAVLRRAQGYGIAASSLQSLFDLLS